MDFLVYFESILFMAYKEVKIKIFGGYPFEKNVFLNFLCILNWRFRKKWCNFRKIN